MKRWSINGAVLGATTCSDQYFSLLSASNCCRITCIDLTGGPEGVCINLVATGHASGVITLWNSHTLARVVELRPVIPVLEIDLAGTSTPIKGTPSASTSPVESFPRKLNSIVALTIAYSLLLFMLY